MGEIIFGLYVGGFLIYFFFTVVVYVYMSDEPLNRIDREKSARFLIAAPVWPIVAAWWLYAGVRHLIRDANISGFVKRVWR